MYKLKKRGGGPKSKIKTSYLKFVQFIVIQFFRETDRKFSVIMLDVDSKELSSGMSCPPRPFTEPDCLASIQACLEPGGMLVLNLGRLL